MFPATKITAFDVLSIKNYLEFCHYSKIKCHDILVAKLKKLLNIKIDSLHFLLLLSTEWEIRKITPLY